MALDPNRRTEVVDGQSLSLVSLPWFLSQLGARWTGSPDNEAVSVADFQIYMVTRRGAPASGFLEWLRERGFLVAGRVPWVISLAAGLPPSRGVVGITPQLETFLAYYEPPSAGGGGGGGALLLGGAAIVGLLYYMNTRR